MNEIKFEGRKVSKGLSFPIGFLEYMEDRARAEKTEQSTLVYRWIIKGLEAEAREKAAQEYSAHRQ